MRTRSLLAACAIAATLAPPARAQSLEPRAYSPAPLGLNFLIAGPVVTQGGVSVDPALPVTDPKLKTTSALFAYGRTLGLWGHSGKFDIIVPYTQLNGSAVYQGTPVERDVKGFADPLARLSVNFFGAPALSAAEFKSYEQDLILGGSLQVSVPAGQYDPSRLVNIGTHRWSFKPELALSKAQGPWIVELQAGVTLFTDNDDFFGGKKRSQDPLYSLQAHTIYNFSRGFWASLGATWFGGGRSAIDGVVADNRQQNWRVGATLALPVDASNSLKAYASRGVSARTGNSFDLLGVAWQYRWFSGP